MAARRRLLVSASVLVLAGCGLIPAGGGSGVRAGCPADDWDAAVIWSSETARHSHLDYVHGDAVVGSETWPYRGLEPSPDAAPFRDGTDAWLHANGDAQRSSTHVLRWSQTDCSVQAFEVDEQAIWDVTADETAFYTTNTVDHVAQVHRRTTDGEIAGEAEVPMAVFSSLTLDGGQLHATGMLGEPGAEQTVLVTFDAETMQEQGRLLLGPASTPVSTLVHDGELYLPGGSVTNPDGSENEVSTVVVADPGAGTSRTVELGVLSPFLVVASPRGPIFAHTYLNPAFRDMDDYDEVSVVDAGTGEVTTIGLRPGLRQIAVSGDELLVLTQQVEGAAQLTTYALSDLQEVSSVEIRPPEGGRHYLGGILARLPDTPN